MRRVNPRTQTPVPATILILVVGVVLMVALPGAALMQLIMGDDPACAHLRRGHGPLPGCAQTARAQKGGFSLGRFELPVAIAALIWVAAALVFLVTPGDATVPTLVVLGLILAGGIYFAKMMIFNREVLDTEPSGGDAVNVSSGDRMIGQHPGAGGGAERLGSVHQYLATLASGRRLCSHSARALAPLE